MFDLVAGLLGGMLGGSSTDRRQRRSARQRRLRFERGEEVKFPCSVRRHGRTAWMHGEVTASRAAGTYWTPPAMRTPRINLDPARLEITGVREVGRAEKWAVNPNHGIVSCRIGGEELDLAMAKSDLKLMRPGRPGRVDRAG